MRERHREVVQLALDPADLAEGLAEIDLGVAWRMRQGDEHLLGPAFLLPDVVGNDRDAAGEAVLGAQALEDPLRRMPLLLRQRPVRLEDLVDDRDERIQLRACWRLRSPVSWRHRVFQNLPHRLAVDAKHPRRFALAHPFDMARPALPTVEFHAIHLPAFSSLPQAQGADFYSETVRPPDRFRCPICLRDSHRGRCFK